MWLSVLSQGRPVPLPVPSISQMQRSPQDRNRLRPLARLIPPGSLHRSMPASTTRPVRHNVPSQLSIVARPHRMASCVPGELIPCAFVWHDPELPHVAEVAEGRGPLRLSAEAGALPCHSCISLG